MKAFDYLVADSLDVAVTEYNDTKPVLKAGGIDLLDMMKERLTIPGTVLSIGSIKDLSYIKQDGEKLRIGCLTTLAEIGRSKLIAEKYKLLHTAAAHAATPQIRERATLGGNLCQRPRCWYFRSNDFDCLKKGGATCFAVDGENQYHAIFGEDACHIVHPSNTAPALVALNARIMVKGKSDSREIPAEKFFVTPGQSLKTENVLADGEIISEVIIDAVPQQSATIELREKQSFDWPLAIASVARINGAWRVCMGAVAPIPWLSKPAMEVLESKDITEQLAIQASDAAVKDAKPMSGNSYKVQLARVAVMRALMSAGGMEVPS